MCKCQKISLYTLFNCHSLYPDPIIATKMDFLILASVLNDTLILPRISFLGTLESTIATYSLSLVPSLFIKLLMKSLDSTTCSWVIFPFPLCTSLNLSVDSLTSENDFFIIETYLLRRQVLKNVVNFDLPLSAAAALMNTFAPS